MSKTDHHRGQKNRWIGWDLWSRRGDMGMTMKNTYSKFLTRRRERAQDKEKLIQELKNS